MKVFILIFGAAIKPNGEPSGTMLRRTLSAIDIAQHHANVVFMPTGAKGNYGEAEAVEMSKILTSHGVPEDLIIREEASHDTLDSIDHCCELLKQHARAGDRVLVCSSGYHNPRCILLFRLMGVGAESVRVRPELGELQIWKLIYFYGKEIPAIIWDVALVLISLLTGKRNRIRLDTGVS